MPAEDVDLTCARVLHGSPTHATGRPAARVVGLLPLPQHTVIISGNNGHKHHGYAVSARVVERVPEESIFAGFALKCRTGIRLRSDARQVTGEIF